MRNKIKRNLKMLEDPLFEGILDVDWVWNIFSDQELCINLSWAGICPIDTVYIDIDEFFAILAFMCEDVESCHDRRIHMYTGSDSNINSYTLSEWIDEFSQEWYYKQILIGHYKDALAVDYDTPETEMNWTAKSIYLPKAS